jgi:hypothetical protein
MSLSTFSVVLNHGPFPLPALPGLLNTAGRSAIPLRPACPSPASGWSMCLTTRGLPVLHRSSSCCCMHAVATTPVELQGASFVHFPGSSSLPRNLGGSASTSRLSRLAQRSLTLRPAYSPSDLHDPLHRRLQPLDRANENVPWRPYQSGIHTGCDAANDELQIHSLGTWPPCRRCGKMGTEAHYIQTLSKWADAGQLTDRTTQEKRRQTRFTDPGTPQRLTPERVVSGERVPILTSKQASATRA